MTAILFPTGFFGFLAVALLISSLRRKADR